MCGNCFLSNNEKDELENLRNKVQILEDLCLPAKFKDMWNAGWFSRKIASDIGNTSLEMMNELYAEDLENLIQTELSELDKDYDE